MMNNLMWQVVRVRARKVKDVSSKIQVIIDFYYANRSKENYQRVINWLQMSMLAVKAHQHTFIVRIKELPKNGGSAGHCA